jgi:hypothetical protein
MKLHEFYKLVIRNPFLSYVFILNFANIGLVPEQAQLSHQSRVKFG